MPREYRKRAPGSEPVPVYPYPEVPRVLVQRLILETPRHFNGGFINPEFGTVVNAEDETTVCTLTHTP
jgi:hypothetical protein